MTPISDTAKIELRVLAHLVESSAHAKTIVSRVGITEDDFTSQDRRDAFRLLVAEPNDDHIYRLQELHKPLPQLAKNDFLDYFLGLAPASTTLCGDLIDLITATYRRETSSANANILARTLDPVAIDDAMKAEQAKLLDLYKHRLGIINTLGAPPAAEPSPSASRYAIDPALLSVPGFVNDLAGYTMNTAPRPNRVLAFAGALTTLAHLAGRKFYGPNDAFPNLYIVALAGSACGKDHPRKVAINIAREAHISASVVQSVASGQALEDGLLRMPALLCQFDEFDSVLRELKNDRTTSSSMESLWRTLLNVFTSSGSTITTRIRASGQNNKPTGGEEIHHPSFTVFATSIPENFYGALSMRALTGGLFGRFLVIEAGNRGSLNDKAGLQDHPLPFFIMEKVTYLAQMQPLGMDPRVASPQKVDFADEAASEVWKRIAKEADALYDNDKAGEMERSLWGRAVEQVMKLALLYALSVDLKNPVITVAAIEWAWRFVKAVQDRMICMARDYVSVDEMDDQVLKALRKIRDAGKDGIKHSDLMKNMHVSSKKMNEVITTLEERGDIVVDILPSLKKSGKRYRIIERDAK